MDIHEYQAKKILSDFGIRIPRGGIAYSPENAEFKAREIGGSKVKSVNSIIIRSLWASCIFTC